MKKITCAFILFLSIFLLISSCGPGEATFNVKSQKFGPNAVIGVYSRGSSEALVLKNLENKPLTFKLNPQNPGYARLSVHAGTSNDFWIYLDKDTYEIELNADQKDEYPVKGASTAMGKELITFYKIKQPAEQAIRTFAKKNPFSMLSLFLMEHYGEPEENNLIYKSIFNSLDASVRESSEGRKMSQEIERIARMQPGAKMAIPAGKNLSGTAFDPKILKKINVFICWISYDGPSRNNNITLVNLYEKYKNLGVEFIGISYDRYEKWWKAVVKDDNLAWPQYADLLGAKSPNPGNLSNYRAPYMFITDQSGKILSTDVTAEHLDFEIENRLAQVNSPPL